MSKPQIWHHGLVARYSAAFWSAEGGADADFFRRLIESAGQPALELGCGTGRLLLPYLQAGLDVDGCDYSHDMLAQCHARAAMVGLTPRLYAQAIHELDLPRRYHLIYACGVIGLGGDRRLTRQGLQRCYAHLRDGGLFAFDLTARWNEPHVWMSRLPDQRRTLPEEWPVAGERKPLPDGTEIDITARTIFVDPFEERQGRQLRARLWRNGAVVEEQIQTQHYEEYGTNELRLLLELAGFTDVTLVGDYHEESATADHETVIFLARK